MSFLLFAVGHFLAVIFPGQTFIGMVNLAIKQNFKSTIPFVIGVGVGNLIFVCIAVFGLSEIIFKYKSVSLLFYLVSAMYLMYFGFKLLNEKQKNQPIEIKPKKAFLTGMLIEVSNPKSIFFAASLVAIVIKPSSTMLLKYFIVLWLFAVSMIYELLIIWIFSIYRLKLMKYLRILNKIFSVLLFIFALKLLLLGINLIQS